MRTLSFCFLALILVQGTVLGQSGDDDYRNVKDELASIVEVLHDYKSDVPNYQILINEYDQIAAGINGTYKKAARRIANGYTLVKRKNITKKNTDIKESIDYYHRKAERLYLKIGTAIDQARGGNSSLIASAHSDGGVLFGTAIVTLVAIVAEILERKACKSAKHFYEDARWLKSKELISGEPDRINWKIVLGSSCASTFRS